MLMYCDYVRTRDYTVILKNQTFKKKQLGSFKNCWHCHQMSASGNPLPPKKCWCTLWMVPNRSFTNANWDQLSMTSPTRMMFLTFICLFIFSNIAYSKPYVPWKNDVGRELQSSFPWKPLYDSFSWSRLIKKRSLSNNSKYFLFVYFAFLENYNSRSTYKNFGHTYIND